MLRESRGLSPVASCCWLLLGLAACTFPSIDYDDGAGATAAAAPCPAPPKCVTEVSSCSKQAETQRGACLSQCGMGPTPDCTACQDKHATAVNTCIAQCESCSWANGCTNAIESCTALVGGP